MNALTIDPLANPKEYARIFNDTNRYWEKKPEYNRLFLKHTENYLNDVLQVRGHVFLNEVYDKLGFQRTPKGQLIGWLRDGEGVGRIIIDVRGIQNGTNWTYWLDFNVDGIIYDQI